VTNGVEVIGVTKNYSGLRVLQDVTTHFEAGQFTSLLGPSGSGKTTLLRIVAGFVAQDAGTVRIAGGDMNGIPVWQRRIGMVFQSYALFPHMTVEQNVMSGLNRRGVRGEAASREVARALELVRLTGFGERRPKQLSGGQQQRVAPARAIVTRPTVLLLDEPLSALDRRLRQEMQGELRRIQQESGLTTILVTHDQEEALTLSDRVAILDRGRIVQEGAPASIYERPRTRFAAAFLGDANFLTGRVTPDGLEVPGGLIRTDAATPAQGMTATFAIRPEKVTILPATAPADAGDNWLPATVRAIIYAGAASTYLLNCGSATEFKVFAQNREVTPPLLGQQVVLAWSPRHTIPVED